MGRYHESRIEIPEDQFVELQCCRGGESGCGQLGATHAYQDRGRKRDM